MKLTRDGGPTTRFDFQMRRREGGGGGKNVGGVKKSF